MAKPLRLVDLLEDPIYNQWFNRVPVIRQIGHSKPWFVYVKAKKKSGWARAEFKSYKKALKFVNKHLGDYYDMVISAKRHEFKPPVVRSKGKKYYWPTPPGHKWCPYCRRPTVFKYFERHHALKGMSVIIPDVKRCSVCGVKEDYVPRLVYAKGTPKSRWAA